MTPVRDPNNQLTTYLYDNADRLTRVVDRRGQARQFILDKASRVTSEDWLIIDGDMVLGIIRESAYVYDDLGRLTFASDPDSAITYLYAAASRVTSIVHSSSAAGTLATHTYSLYDDANQLRTYTGPEGTLNYNYDNDSQLTGTTGARTETYAYDVNGNRTSANGSSYGAPSAGNRLTSDGTYNYTYDFEGNITLKERISDGQRTEYGWDYLNRLTIVVTRDAAAGPVVQEVRFSYDLLGRRIGKRVDADGDGTGGAVQTWTAYDGFNPYADFDAAGTLTQRYLYGPGLDFLLARRSAAGDTAWYLTDRLGSVWQVVNTNGSILYSATYDSYGKVVSETGTGGDRFKYTSREYDPELEQYFYRARYYGPAVGRFYSDDPWGFAAGDRGIVNSCG